MISLGSEVKGRSGSSGLFQEEGGGPPKSIPLDADVIVSFKQPDVGYGVEGC